MTASPTDHYMEQVTRYQTRYFLWEFGYSIKTTIQLNYVVFYENLGIPWRVQEWAPTITRSSSTERDLHIHPYQSICYLVTLSRRIASQRLDELANYQRFQLRIRLPKISRWKSSPYIVLVTCMASVSLFQAPDIFITHLRHTIDNNTR
jgi:hypothetical protein